MSKILFFLLIISSSYLQAQSTLITGKIIVDDAEEVIDLEGTLIENLTTKAKTKANNVGLFSINVNLNDELLIKHTGIEERRLKVSERMITKGFVTIHVNIEVIELKEANISKLNIDKLNKLGKNKSASKEIVDATGVNDKEFQKAVVERHNWAAFHRKDNPYAGNLLEIVKLFKTPNGKGILDKKRISTYEKIIDLKSVIGETFFIKDLKLSRSQIIDFIGTCYYSNNFDKLIRKKNFNRIKQILKEQAPNYLSIINQKPIEHE
ncbi:hypothetical protein [Empedobacter sp. UBA1574]|uniref:hypothetical protein n=1 Tax=Empedobacter sp. UBA1574 TaxID=1946429 RepID=UPI0025C48E3C|nr:hypothetical protein [Empedobacter sp. UBA1574]